MLESSESMTTTTSGDTTTDDTNAPPADGIEKSIQVPVRTDFTTEDWS